MNSTSRSDSIGGGRATAATAPPSSTSNDAVIEVKAASSSSLFERVSKDSAFDVGLGPASPAPPPPADAATAKAPRDPPRPDEPADKKIAALSALMTQRRPGRDRAPVPTSTASRPTVGSPAHVKSKDPRQNSSTGTSASHETSSAASSPAADGAGDGAEPKTPSAAPPLAMKNVGGAPKVYHGKGSFPLNLANMLESVESMKLSHIVCWLPTGESFAIHNPNQFLAVCLPKFFKSNKNTKLRSFYRKLNRWGFSILRNHLVATQGGGSMRGVWHHSDFHRTRVRACLKTVLETGDTSAFLSITHSKAEDGRAAMAGDEAAAAESPQVMGDGAMGFHIGSGPGWGEEMQLAPEGDGRRLLAGTKRRTASPHSLRGSIITESSELPRHRESDFSLGGDSFARQLEGDNFLSQVALQAGGGGFNLAGSFNTDTAAVGPAAVASGGAGSFNLGGSFTSGGVAWPMMAASGGEGFNLGGSFTAGGMAGPMAEVASSGVNFNLASSFNAGTGAGLISAAPRGDGFNLAGSYTPGTTAGSMAAATGDFNLAGSFAAGTTAGPMAAATSGDNFNIPSSFNNGAGLAEMRAAAVTGLVSERGRRNAYYVSNATSAFQPHQPVIAQSSAAAAASNGRVSASWTAGSAFSQQDFNFPPSSPFSFDGSNELAQGGGQGLDQMLDNNDKVDRLEELTSTMVGCQGGQNPQSDMGEGHDGQDEVSSGDVDLATFFQKFEESLQK